MNCRRARELFSPRIDHELSTTEEVRLEAHLGACAACGARWRSFASTVQMIRDLPPVGAEPNFVGQVLDRVRAYEAGRRGPAPLPRRRWAERLGGLVEGLAPRGWAVPVRFAGAVALGLLVGFVVADRGLGPRSSTESGSTATLAQAAPAVPGGAPAAAVPSGPVPRPFGDLVEQISSRRPIPTAEDSLPPTGAAPDRPLDGPQGSGRQVGLIGGNGRPQITF